MSLCLRPPAQWPVRRPEGSGLHGRGHPEQDSPAPGQGLRVGSRGFSARACARLRRAASISRRLVWIRAAITRGASRSCSGRSPARCCARPCPTRRPVPPPGPVEHREPPPGSRSRADSAAISPAAVSPRRTAAWLARMRRSRTGRSPGRRSGRARRPRTRRRVRGGTGWSADSLAPRRAHPGRRDRGRDPDDADDVTCLIQSTPAATRNAEDVETSAAQRSAQAGDARGRL